MTTKAASEWGKAGGALRWKGKTKAEKLAHVKMMSDKATAARKKKKRQASADSP